MLDGFTTRVCHQFVNSCGPNGISTSVQIPQQARLHPRLNAIPCRQKHLDVVHLHRLCPLMSNDRSSRLPDCSRQQAQRNAGCECIDLLADPRDRISLSMDKKRGSMDKRASLESGGVAGRAHLHYLLPTRLIRLVMARTPVPICIHFRQMRSRSQRRRRLRLRFCSASSMVVAGASSSNCFDDSPHQPSMRDSF
jgi:hypothetical protein